MKTKSTLASLCLIAAGLGTLGSASPARAADAAPAPAAPPAPAAADPAAKVTLPQKYDDQRVIRDFMAKLTEKDFTHGITAELPIPPVDPDPEHQYRAYLMSMVQQPHVGGKRGIGAVNCPPLNFLLTTIEGPKAIIIPPVWPEALGTFIQWDSPANLYRGNKALKMRAFVTCAIKMMMFDDHLERLGGRADWSGYNLIQAASAYPVFKAELPAEVQKAFEAGLLRLGRRVIAMGPKGGECDYELSAPVALWYVANGTGDAAFAKEAEAYTNKILASPKFLHPAGYWVEGGGFDVGFGGMANFWAVWLAVASDWPAAKEAVDKIYRLRAHLILPEPDGTRAGPTAFNDRLGSPASEDQWDWDGSREPAAAMITDEALCQFKLPTQEQLEGGMTIRVRTFNGHLYGDLKNAPYMEPDGKRSNRYLENDELRGAPWRYAIFPNGFNYPIEVNPGHDFYRPGSWAHIVDLQKKNSPMLKSPYLREGNFVRNFGDAFIATKQKGFAAVLHVGPVGDPIPEEPMFFFNGILGFGGGQLSAFWTPTAGSAILARRGGMAMHGTTPVNYDKIEEWRTWPLHAVTGVTAEGKVFTSGRISKPVVASDIKENVADVKVSGVIPAKLSGQEGGITGELSYARAFHIDDKGVHVETTLSGDGKDKIAELYETIHVFHRDANKQPNAKGAAIEFRAGGADAKWAPATDAWTEKVQAVRVTRFAGTVVITFDSPRRVKLSPKDWGDTFLSRGTARTVLVDLLETGDQPAAVKEAKKVGYLVAAGEK
ncbi:MAG: hypothetical protein NTW19_15330 [Planctomycetota bacterium]|nr:hypothetical protein [Planctomycetota bacterium]